MRQGLVIGQSWEAKTIGKILSLPSVPLSEANKEMLKRSRFVISVDEVPEGHTLGKWRWFYHVLAMRVAYHASYWLQLSSMNVLTGNEYDRPYRASDPVNPGGVRGQVLASLEWATQSLGYPVCIVRKSILMGKPFMEWARQILQSNPVVSPDLISPTSIYDFAEHLVEIVDDGRVGVMHLANSGHGTYRDVLQSIADCLDMEVDIQVAPTRPMNLAITSSHRLRDWSRTIIDLANV